MKTASANSLLIGCWILTLCLGTPPAPAAPATPGELAGQLARSHAYLFSPDDFAALDEINRRIREAESQARNAKTDTTRERARRAHDEGVGRLIALLEKSPHLRRLSISGDKVEPPNGGTVTLPGDSGAILAKIDAGPGEPRCVVLSVDYSQIQWERSLVEVQLGKGGTTWALIGVNNVPVKRIHTSVRLTYEDGRMLHWPVDFVTPEKARLQVNIQSEDGGPTPAMVRLTWKTGGAQDVRPANAVDIAPQFDAQGSAVSRRATNLPGALSGEFWCVPGSFDMAVAPGDYQIVVRRGAEHVPIVQTFTAKPGETVEKTFKIERWVDMRRHGWFSGDDHVHNRILSDDDARRLMTWIKAEDIHLANVVKMGDIYRTWFEQRGFGKEFRVIDGDYILSPGQECPRTHDQIGHTISMNITSMVRDTDRYYAYDWVAKTVHEQGGLFGYAHVNSGMFHVHRDMSMNIPAGNIDFVELLQFAHLGTDLYYEFLNLGYKVTASAGSDVPWGGTVGEVRVYARVDPKNFSAETWFDAVRRGRTFVSNGPMIDFHVDDAGPGDEIKLNADRKLRVRARAWGDPGRMQPIRLEIIRHGEPIRSAESTGGKAEAQIDFEVEAGHGSWVAARVEGGDGTRAHTTPVYVVREGLRFWKIDAVNDLIARRLSNLDEVENIVRKARDAVAAGGVISKEAGDDRSVRELAEQGDDLLKRVEIARKTFAELKNLAARERELRK